MDNGTGSTVQPISPGEFVRRHPLFVIVVAAISVYLMFTTVRNTLAPGPSSSALPSADPNVARHRTLDAAALEVALGSHGPTGRVEIGGYQIGCDKVFDVSLTEQDYGTIAAGTDRLPAIKAHFSYTCVSSMDGARQPESRFWVVVARDDFAGMYRCISVAGRDVVDENARQCDFQPETPVNVASHALREAPKPLQTEQVAVTSIAPSVPVTANPISTAVDPDPISSASLPAASSVDYAHEGLDVVKLAAERGDASAQAEFGVRLQNGSAGTKDLPQAREWYERAAKQGNPRAQTNLGWLFVLGQGTARDDARALALFREAATTGFPNAEDSLGWMYQNGRGVDKDLVAAREWYTKAAAQGFKKSQENLAKL